MFRNLTLVLVSVCVSVLMAEGVLRLVLNPVDYLMVTPVEDAFLSHRIAPNDGGHDAWGFRNQGVPKQAEIVAIGDSMTYGMMAKSTESWPAHLSRTLDQPIYNMGLGGYGPLQYLRLLKTRAADLKAKTVLISLYFGNDLFDVYNLAYGNDKWSAYRQDMEGKTGDGSATALPESTALLRIHRGKPLFGRIRHWLSENSVFYRIITQSQLFDHYRVEQAVRLSSASFVHEIAGQNVILEPETMLKFVDLQDPRIAVSLDITLSVIREIQDFCLQNDIELAIVVIPIKENVYWPAVVNDLQGEKLALMQELHENISEIRDQLFAFLEKRQIVSIDVLPDLRVGVLDAVLYPESDGHPNGQGYSLIADVIAKALTSSSEPTATKQ